MRLNVGTPSISGRTRLPGRTGYAPASTKGMEGRNVTALRA
jgi:hypothetical protein